MILGNGFSLSRRIVPPFRNIDALPSTWDKTHARLWGSGTDSDFVLSHSVSFQEQYNTTWEASQ
jgi:hypothetical protein